MIDTLQRACASRRDVIGFAGGLPDETQFPRELIADAMRAALDGDPSALQYGWPEGDERLRSWIARRCSSSPNDVIVTTGAQQAIALAVDVLTQRGDRLGVSRATYPAVLSLCRTRALEPTSHGAPAAFYLMPEIDNPEGAPLDACVAARVERTQAPVIADDAYAELRCDGARRPRAFGETWRVGTFAKTLCPGLRVGWLIPPRQAHACVLRRKHAADLQASGIGQAVLVELLSRLDYDEHLRRARLVYARRAAGLLEALRKHLPAWTFREPQGGFSVFVDTREPGDDVSLLSLAIAHGVSFDPGSSFRPEPHETLELRLCYSNVPEALIEEGVVRLARAWERSRRA